MLQKRIRKICEKTCLYRLSLIGKEELSLVDLFADPWPAQVALDIDQFKMLLSHRRGSFWNVPYFASFEWIRDLKASQDLTIRAHIRDIILFWIHTNQRFFSPSWSDFSWRADIVGLRLWNTLALFDFYGTSGSEAFKQTLIKSVTEQFKQLLRIWDDSSDPLIQFKAIKGIIGFLCASKKSSVQRLEYWRDILTQVVEEQILSDGGHISRNPTILLLFLRDLIDIRAVLSKNNIESHVLSRFINQIAPVVRLFRHGDGRLARFVANVPENEAQFLPDRINIAFIDMCLSLADSGRRPPTCADDMGYIRCVNQSGVFLFSSKPEIGLNQDHFCTNLFNFEWSYDRQMVIEKCELLLDLPEFDGLPIDQPVTIIRNMEDEYTFINAECKFGELSLNRKIYMSGQETNIRGEDIITGHQNGIFALRFVLSPDIEVLPDSKTTKSVILKLSASNVKAAKKLARITTLQFLVNGCYELTYQKPEGDQQHALILLSTLEPKKTMHCKWAFILNG
jgi:uncharacterized heparinase superfamily protein